MATFSFTYRPDEETVVEVRNITDDGGRPSFTTLDIGPKVAASLYGITFYVPKDPQSRKGLADALRGAADAIAQGREFEGQPIGTYEEATL